MRDTKKKSRKTQEALVRLLISLTEGKKERKKEEDISV
jgi:hypothetical protein